MKSDDKCSDLHMINALCWPLTSLMMQQTKCQGQEESGIVEGDILFFLNIKRAKQNKKNLSTDRRKQVQVTTDGFNN